MPTLFHKTEHFPHVAKISRFLTWSYQIGRSGSGRKMMVKKSEFAQKLLDDLRMRKEKIASGTGQTYGQSHSSMVAQDAHGQSIKGHRSTSIAAASKTGTYKTNGMHRRSSSCVGRFEVEHISKQLVPFSQGHNAKQMGDVSAAIDFVFQNGHKLMMDSSMSISMHSFLRQITHGSVIDFQNSERKSNIKISTFHINEVSKGAQKLAKILAASSEGHNTENYSIEIGKELFRGAKDLVESLRMLVSLKEAANNKNTQQKSKIRLLEGNEEDDDDNQVTLEKQKQIDKPRFSFDKMSHSNKKREESTSVRQRSVALAYLTNGQPSNSNSNLSMVSIASQRQSYSHIGESSGKTAASEKGNETSFNRNTSKPEKKCLPNIIAKLMGLEEVSQHSESKNEKRKESHSKLDGKVKLTPNSTDSHKTNKGAEFSQSQIVEKILLQSDRIPIFMGASFGTPVKKRQSCDNLSSQSGNQGKNKLQKDMENAEEKGLSLSEGDSTFKMQEKKSSQRTQHQMIQKESQGRTKFAKEREAKNSTQRVPRSHQKNIIILPRKGTREETKTESEIRNLNRRFTHNQQTAQVGFGLSKRKLLGQPEIIDQRRKVDRTEKKSGINGSHKKDQADHQYHETQQHHNRKSVPASADVHSVVTRDFVSSNDETSCIFTSYQAIDEDYDHSLISKDQGDGAGSKTSNAPPLKEDKNAQIKTSLNKVPKSKVHKSNSLKMADQVIMRNQDSPQWLSSRSLEHQSTSLKEAEFQQDDRTKIVADDSSRSGAQQLQSTTKPPLNEVENPSALQTPYLTDITQVIASYASSHEHAPSSRIENIGEPGVCIIQSKEAGGVERISSAIPDHLDTLNEEETQLKCMLVLSLHFRNTAEALFKLNIPVNRVLQADNQECEDMEQKHILEAAYEIMERKARRHELKVNPFTKCCISCPKVLSLNDLVKQLHKDLETLKCYGGVWGNDMGAYLLKMVERDMYCTDPDINCTWEYGWNNDWCFALAEKNGTIEEVEKRIIDDLLDDIMQVM